MTVGNKMDESKAGRSLESEEFFGAVNLELKRAERYRIFVSLIAFDLTAAGDVFGNGDSGDQVAGQVRKLIKSLVREIDIVSDIGASHVGVLFPETSRQGAEIASLRLSTAVREHFSKRLGDVDDLSIPFDMASFPDAAGARTIDDFASELAGMQTS